jgi:hypothetical protein
MDVVKSALGANEATTRLRAIDTVLFDVLKWDKTKVETEKYCREVGYSDYAFRQGESLCLILEAKKEGQTFVIPDKQLGDRAIGFGFLEAECPAAGKGLRQACGYAASEGARYVAISNGSQWLLALAFVQGQPIENRSVLVFQSVEDILARFSRFWECFSPDGIYSNRAASLLLESRKAPAPAKLSARITGYPVPASRNAVVNELEVVIGLVWDQMDADEHEARFLRECYIKPVASLDNLDQAREFIQQRNNTDVLVTSEAHSITDLPDLIIKYRAEKPVIILGRIGHGKSTFLRYLRLVAAPAELKKYIQLDIDFLDRPENPRQVSDFVYRQIDEQLRTRYSIDTDEDGVVRSALRGDLQRFKGSATGKLYADDPMAYAKAELEKILELQRNRHEYLAKVNFHLVKSAGHSLAIFFDNLDRRIDSIQEEAFLRASAIARDWACLVFVCLRPGTFYRSREGGILDTVAPKTLTVVPPRTDVLLRKRLQYAARIARGEEPLAPGRAPTSPTMSIHLPSTAEVLECAAESFYRQADLRSLFDAVANGNVRDLLRYVRAALTSDHLNTTKIIEKLADNGYRLSVHEMLRALLFGNSMHYYPDGSICVNVFDIVRADPIEHFSRVLALDCLNRIPKTAPDFGYIRLEELAQYLCQIGYSHEHAIATLEYLYVKRCCEADLPDEPWSESISTIRITSLGEYHVNELVCRFNYYDAVVVDTPIIDDNVRARISDVFPIRDRLERGREFVRYLSGCAQALQDGSGVSGLAVRFDAARRDIDVISSMIS